MIGKPHDHYPGRLSSHQDGGYIDERLAKLEYFMQTIENEMSSCKVCKSHLLTTIDTYEFPICNRCLDSINKANIITEKLKRIS